MSAESPYSAFFDLSHVVTYPIATCSVMFLAYGFYILLFILCIDVLSKSRRDSTGRTATHGLYFWSTVSLFVAGTINVIFFTHDIVRRIVFIVTALKTGDDSGLGKYVTHDKVHDADVAIYSFLAVISNVLADLMLVHRCYVVWNYKKRVGFLLVLTTIINVLGLVSIIIEAVGMRDTRNLDNYRLYEHGDDIERVYNGAHAAANLLITILTASRIWRSSREARGSLDSGVRRLYQRVVAIILESGVLYPILTFVNIALIESASEIGTPIYLFPTVTLIAGIAPTLMIVRCKVFNALQDHSVREAGALTTVQFNVNTGTDSTFDQYGSQVRGLETQVRSEEPVMKGESNGDGSNHDEEKGAHVSPARAF